MHDQLKRDPYEDTDVEVDGRLQDKRANWKPKGKGAHLGTDKLIDSEAGNVTSR